MPKAIWSEAVLAESQTTEVVEGSHYFPPDSIKRQYFKDSSTHTTCGWKGRGRESFSRACQIRSEGRKGLSRTSAWVWSQDSSSVVCPLLSKYRMLLPEPRREKTPDPFSPIVSRPARCP